MIETTNNPNRVELVFFSNPHLEIMDSWLQD